MQRTTAPKKTHSKKISTMIHQREPGIVVGTFGVQPKVPGKFNQLRVAWVVGRHRRDKRTGPQQTRPMGRYAKSLLDACFRKWG